MEYNYTISSWIIYTKLNENYSGIAVASAVVIICSSGHDSGTVQYESV